MINDKEFTFQQIMSTTNICIFILLLTSSCDAGNPVLQQNLPIKEASPVDQLKSSSRDPQFAGQLNSSSPTDLFAHQLRGVNLLLETFLIDKE